MAKGVMVVDDSQLMRSFIKRSIETSGLAVHTFLEAADGREALEQLRARTSPGVVDVILTDLSMPVLDGVSLLAVLKRDSALAPIPVVIISSDATQYSAESLLRRGAAAYLSKPFPPERLGAVLRRVLPDWQSE